MARHLCRSVTCEWAARKAQASHKFAWLACRWRLNSGIKAMGCELC